MWKITLKMTFIILNLQCIAIAAPVRIKDLVTIKGVRENALVGYGLVVGLNGTGDSGGEAVNSSLKKLYEKLGMNLKSDVISKNVAAVIVTAKLPAFARLGQKLDVTVSSIGDSGSLAGGTLIVTPLKGGDGNIYAMANGPISIGGIKKGAKMATTGTIANAATVEKEIPHEFDQKNAIRLALNRSDFTTAARIEKTLNDELGGKFANASDSTTIDLMVPPYYERSIVQLIAIIENYKVNPDQKAKIVINERTGTIVAGGDVMVSPVAISHGDLSIEIKGNAKPATMMNLPEGGTTLTELVKGLNSFGATPEDLISIFQALKKNGSLIGDIEFI